MRWPARYESCSNVVSRTRCSSSSASNGGARTTETIRLAESEPLDLDATLGCGQAFRWRHAGNDGRASWTGGASASASTGACCTYSGADEPFVRHYLALDLDLDRILAAIDRDPVIGAAMDSCRGLRVVRQPLFECLLSYLCATNTNIPAVRHRVEALASRYGEPVADGGNLRAFPSPGALITASEVDFRACRLGYRARYAAICSRDRPGRPGVGGGGPSPLPRRGPRLVDGSPGYRPQSSRLHPSLCTRAHRCVPDRRLDPTYPRPPLPARFGEGPLSPSRYEAARAFGRDRFGPYAGYAQVYLYGARLLLCRSSTSAEKATGRRMLGRP